MSAKHLYTLRETIKIPAAATAVSFASTDVLCIGSVDGTLRLYNLPSTKVIKAFRQLGDEISSVVWSKPYNNNEQGVAWVACGRKAFCFDMENSKMIMTAVDARKTLDLGEDDEDVLNELSINENTKLLAFSTDSGTVGIVDISTHEISRMKSKHETICGSVSFIPSRTNELVSGGYDSTLLHFDIMQRNTLSRYKITVPEPAAGISLSPSFVLSLALSSTGLIAAGLADGRVFLGTGGDKNAPSSQKKRARKWEGLRDTNAATIHVAEGPVVGVSFLDANSLVTCTLLGKLAVYTLSYDNEGVVLLEKTWSTQTKSIEKVNAINAMNAKWLVITGLGQDGRGVAEVWEPDNSINADQKDSSV